MFLQASGGSTPAAVLKVENANKAPADKIPVILSGYMASPSKHYGVCSSSFSSKSNASLIVSNASPAISSIFSFFSSRSSMSAV